MSWLEAPPRVSPQTAQAKPSGRTESASDWTFAGLGEMSIEADHEPPLGLRATRTWLGEARASIHAAMRLLDPSTPMRARVCAPVPGSSETLTLPVQLSVEAGPGSELK